MLHELGALDLGDGPGDVRGPEEELRPVALPEGSGAAAFLLGEHPHEAGFLKLDSSKAHAELAWRPRLRLQTGLAWVVEWYKHLAQGGDVRAKRVEQLQRYERLWVA